MAPPEDIDLDAWRETDRRLEELYKDTVRVMRCPECARLHMAQRIALTARQEIPIPDCQSCNYEPAVEFFKSGSDEFINDVGNKTLPSVQSVRDYVIGRCIYEELSHDDVAVKLGCSKEEAKALMNAERLKLLEYDSDAFKDPDKLKIESRDYNTDSDDPDKDIPF